MAWQPILHSCKVETPKCLHGKKCSVCSAQNRCSKEEPGGCVRGPVSVRTAVHRALPARCQSFKGNNPVLPPVCSQEGHLPLHRRERISEEAWGLSVQSGYAWVNGGHRRGHSRQREKHVQREGNTEGLMGSGIAVVMRRRGQCSHKPEGWKREVGKYTGRDIAEIKCERKH